MRVVIALIVFFTFMWIVMNVREEGHFCRETFVNWKLQITLKDCRPQETKKGSNE